MPISVNKIYYLAYGSNLHPVRLGERIPSARFIDSVSLDDFSIRFHKKGRDGSGKCNIIETANLSDSVFTALYEMDAAHKASLDRYEGCGYGYQDRFIKISHSGEEYNCLTYLAQPSHIDENLFPYHWYKELVVLGALYLGFPESYVEVINRSPSIADHNVTRLNEMQNLIERMKLYQRDRASFDGHI